MKFCETHWNVLTQELKDKGLWHLVSSSNEELAKRLEEGEPDPLFHVSQAIYSKAVSIGGTGMLSLDGDKENEYHHCPVCVAIKKGATLENWTKEPVEVLLQAYLDRGYITKQ